VRQGTDVWQTTRYIQSVKAGIEIELNRRQTWSLAPFAQFPLTNSSRTAEYKNSVGAVYNS
jgi:hypothetical protein